MDNVLTYVRPWNSEQFVDLAMRMCPKANIVKISEHKGLDESGFVSDFYSRYSENTANQSEFEFLPFSSDEIEDIVIRCRLLRSLDSNSAKRLIQSASRSISAVLDRFNPRFVLSVTVDSYIIDLIARLAKKRGIKFIGIVPTFIDGYFRITERGEKAIDRPVSTEEIDKVLSLLVHKEYKPQWLANSRKAINRKAIKMWAKNFIKPTWFYAYSKIKKDPLNAHYMTTAIISKRYWSLSPKFYNDLGSARAVEHAIKKDSRTPVFLPLQMSPEATIDYWSSDKSWIDYETKVLSIVEEYGNKCVFVVKEHPNVFGLRTSCFYNKLLKNENVILVNPEVSSNEMLEICHSVLVCTGTVGFEALLRGKPVISTSGAFYAPDKEFRSFSSMSMPYSTYSKRDLIEYLLSGCLPGVFINNGSWDRDKHSLQPYNPLISSSIIQTVNEIKIEL